MKRVSSIIQLLFVLFFVLTSSPTKTQSFLEESDSCNSTDIVEAQYYLWIGTRVNESHSIALSVRKYTTFYDVMKIAAERDPQNYTFEATCSEYGHYITSIGGNSEDKETSTFWLIYKLSEPPDIANPPSSAELSLAGVDSIRVTDMKYYLFWRRQINETNTDM